MDWQIIEREGYGASFNTLSRTQTKIKKEAKTDYGRKKILYEIEFFKFLQDKNISFSVPEIYEYGNYSYTMKYYADYIPFFRVWNTIDENKRTTILQKIKNNLLELHESDRKVVSAELYNEYLLIEISTKLIGRIEQIETMLDTYKHIRRVNDTLIRPLPDIIDAIKNKLLKLVEMKNEYYLCPIHGDCQFNNILVKDTDIIFIDPRGYYGNSQIYGIPEYDDAKIRFALSGYDVFDSMTVVSLNTVNDTIYVDDLRLRTDCIDSNDFSSILALSIWLGNAHCFMNNPQKAMYSYAYAMWLVNLYLPPNALLSTNET
jgi:hypothetical protein